MRRLVEEAGRVEEVRKAEEVRRVEKAQRVREARRAAEARISRAEEARQAERVRQVEQQEEWSRLVSSLGPPPDSCGTPAPDWLTGVREEPPGLGEERRERASFVQRLRASAGGRWSLSAPAKALRRAFGSVCESVEKAYQWGRRAGETWTDGYNEIRYDVDGELESSTCVWTGSVVSDGYNELEYDSKGKFVGSRCVWDAAREGHQ